jgi:hypothetical protein
MSLEQTVSFDPFRYLAVQDTTDSVMHGSSRPILLKNSVEWQKRSDLLALGRRLGNIGMMGCQASNQERLFYSFKLDDHVPSNHLLRGIDQFLDLNELRQHLAPYYSHTGRPSIDPELMMIDTSPHAAI